MHNHVAPLVDGPLDIIGDVHGEVDVLRELLGRLGYDGEGRHPGERTLVFLGDLCDRGPDSPGVIELVRSLIERGRAQCILGNHELNILRHDKKDGNEWYFDEGHASFDPARSKPAPKGHTYESFFLTLPVALERPDLRLVHAAWSQAAIDELRASGDATSLELFRRHEESIKNSEYAAAARRQKEANRAALEDETTTPPLLRDIGLYDELKQTRNPVRVLTSGSERLTAQPFFANGTWRMCDRVTWWDEYTDVVPVIVGHYWRASDHDGKSDKAAVNGGKPDLFRGHAPEAWVGARKNVFCVDFSIGGRHKERAHGKTSGFNTHLAAVRWPERQLMFSDGTSAAMVATTTGP